MLTIYHQWISNETIPKSIDLSRTPSTELADTADALLQHHAPCSVFLGYLEPGWMLETKHQIRLRKLIRTFDVHLICFFLESLPFSWKNEIDTIYTPILPTKNGDTQIVHHGGTDHNESQT